MIKELKYDFEIDAYFEKQNDRLVLKIALNKKDEGGSLVYGTFLKNIFSLFSFLMRNLGYNKLQFIKNV